MLTAGDALAKTLVKSQKVTFWSQKMALDVFFFLANCWRCSNAREIGSWKGPTPGEEGLFLYTVVSFLFAPKFLDFYVIAPLSF